MRETLLLSKLNIDLCMCFYVNAVSQRIPGSNFNYCDHDSNSCLVLFISESFVAVVCLKCPCSLKAQNFASGNL